MTVYGSVAVVAVTEGFEAQSFGLPVPRFVANDDGVQCGSFIWHLPRGHREATCYGCQVRYWSRERGMVAPL